MSLKTLQIAFRMVSKKLFFTPKPPKGGLSVIADYGLWIADLKNFLINIKIRNMESSALRNLGVSDQERAFETAS